MSQNTQQQQQNKFIITDIYIEKNIFKPERAKNGPTTTLNTNFLPNLYAYLKAKLTEQQQKNMVEYEVETLLLEMSLELNINKKVRNLKGLVQYIQDVIACNTKYWIQNSDSWKDAKIKEQEVIEELRLQQEEEQKELQQFENFQENNQNQEQTQQNDLEEKINNLIGQVNDKDNDQNEQQLQNLDDQQKNSQDQENNEQQIVKKEKTFEEQVEEKNVKSLIEYKKYIENVQKICQEYEFKQYTEMNDVQKQENDYWENIEKENDYWDQLFSQGPYKILLLHRKMMQVTTPAFFKQEVQSRSTRGNQRKQNDRLNISSINKIQSGYSRREQQFQELQMEDLIKYKSIFSVDKDFKHPKLELYILPYIYQFLLKDFDIQYKNEYLLQFGNDNYVSSSNLSNLKEQEIQKLKEKKEIQYQKTVFQLQNFIMNLIMTTVPIAKKSRQKVKVFMDSDDENNEQINDQQQQQKQIKNNRNISNDRIIDENSNTGSNFNNKFQEGEESDRIEKEFEQEFGISKSKEEKENSLNMATFSSNQKISIFEDAQGDSQVTDNLSELLGPSSNRQQQSQQKLQLQQSENDIQQVKQDTKNIIGDIELEDEIPFQQQQQKDYYGRNQFSGQVQNQGVFKRKTRKEKEEEQEVLNQEKEQYLRSQIIKDNQILKEFSQFLKENKFILQNFFSCGIDVLKKEANLIKNIIILGKYYLSIIGQNQKCEDIDEDKEKENQQSIIDRKKKRNQKFRDDQDDNQKNQQDSNDSDQDDDKNGENKDQDQDQDDDLEEEDQNDNNDDNSSNKLEGDNEEEYVRKLRRKNNKKLDIKKKEQSEQNPYLKFISKRAGNTEFEVKMLEILINLENYDDLYAIENNFNKNKNVVNNNNNQKEQNNSNNNNIVEEIVNFYKKNFEQFNAQNDWFMQCYLKILKSIKENFVTGCFNSQEQVEQSLSLYDDYINDPDTLKKQHYIFHSKNRKEWTEDQYKKFQEGLKLYFNIPINNEKIAKFMGGSINPNHVRYVKGPYLRSLKKRSQDNNITRLEQLQEDIDNFDISIFQKKEKGQVIKQPIQKKVKQDLKVVEFIQNDDDQQELEIITCDQQKVSSSTKLQDELQKQVYQINQYNKNQNNINNSNSYNSSVKNQQQYQQFEDYGENTRKQVKMNQFNKIPSISLKELEEKLKLQQEQLQLEQENQQEQQFIQEQQEKEKEKEESVCYEYNEVIAHKSAILASQDSSQQQIGSKNSITNLNNGVLLNEDNLKINSLSRLPPPQPLQKKTSFQEFEHANSSLDYYQGQNSNQNNNKNQNQSQDNGKFVQKSSLYQQFQNNNDSMLNTQNGEIKKKRGRPSKKQMEEKQQLIEKQKYEEKQKEKYEQQQIKQQYEIQKEQSKLIKAVEFEEIQPEKQEDQ